MAMANGGVSLERVSELGRWSGTEIDSVVLYCILVKNYLRDSTRLERESKRGLLGFIALDGLSLLCLVTVP
jgi:hypothetical protein